MGDGMNGVQLAELMIKDRAGIAVLILSGTRDSRKSCRREGLPIPGEAVPRRDVDSASA
jgi:hypothetical protein